MSVVSSSLYFLGHMGASDVAYPLHHDLPLEYRDVPGYWYDARLAAMERRRRRDSRGKL
jgi:hypothetical protein